MKAQQSTTTSTPVQTFEDYGFAYFYVQPNGNVLTAIPPNPPTPEAVARAQFVDKTYVWKEPGKETKPS